MAWIERDVSSEGSTTSIGAIAGIAVACVGILVLLTCIVVLIVRARKNHQRLITDLENRGINITRGPSIAEITDPSTNQTRTILRKTAMTTPYHTETSSLESFGGNDNSSGEYPPALFASAYHRTKPGNADFSYAIDNNTTIPQAALQRLPSKYKKFNQLFKALDATSRLSAISEAFCESPRSQHRYPLPIISDPDAEYETLPSQHTVNSQQAAGGAHDIEESATEIYRADSPCMDVPARPAVKPASLFTDRSAGGIRLVHESRSKSIGHLPSAETKDWGAPERPAMHQRSVSLCTQKSGRVPSVPVPPLPINVDAERKRQSMALSKHTRVSVSSSDSGGSSIFVHDTPQAASPKRAIRSSDGIEHNEQDETPKTCTELDDGTCSAMSSDTTMRNTARPAKLSRNSQCSSSSRSSSPGSTLANQSGIFKNESSAIRNTQLSKELSPSFVYEELRTPISRRQSRFFIDHKGSPSDRSAHYSASDRLERIDKSSKRTSNRSPSRDRPLSFRPSPMASYAKPSALKGSPNSRKGHRRQNCVRISLAPTILGPCSLRVTSDLDKFNHPSIHYAYTPRYRESSRGYNVRAPIENDPGINSQLNPKKRRAPFATTSPTASLINFCHDNGLPLDQLGLIPNYSLSIKPSDSMVDAESTICSSSPISTPAKDAISCATFVCVPQTVEGATSGDPIKPFLGRKVGSPDHVLAKRINTQNLRSLFERSSPVSSMSPSTRLSFDRSPYAKSQTESSPSAFSTSYATVLPPSTSLKLPSPGADLQDGTPSRSVALVGPRPQPTKPLSRTVQTLRRMNSDVSNSFRAERRYLGLGSRETSPGLSSDGYRDSYADFSAFRRGLARSDRLTMASNGLSVLFDDLDPVSEIDIDDMLSSCESNNEHEIDLSCDTLEWPEADGTMPWDREDSGTLGSAERIHRLYSNSDLGRVDE